MFWCIFFLTFNKKMSAKVVRGKLEINSKTDKEGRLLEFPGYMSQNRAR